MDLAPYLKRSPRKILVINYKEVEKPERSSILVT